MAHRKITKFCIDCETDRPRAEFTFGTKNELRDFCGKCRDKRNVRRYKACTAGRLRYLQKFIRNSEQSRLTCKECKKTKPLRLFAHILYKGMPRYYRRCKDCYNKAQRASRLKNGYDGLKDAHNRRARKMALPYEDIELNDIILRDGLHCYLCDRDISRKDVTLEHVVPLSRGGHHVKTNVRIACKTCNGRKHTKLVSELPWIRHPLFVA